MDKYRKESARRFGIYLRETLRIKYPYSKITSIFLASQFNLRSKTSNTISNETARKWLNGVSLPSVHRFEVLHEWLGIDNTFLANYDDLNYSGPISSSDFESIDTFENLDSILCKSGLFDNKQLTFLKKAISLLKK